MWGWELSLNLYDTVGIKSETVWCGVGMSLKLYDIVGIKSETVWSGVGIKTESMNMILLLELSLKLFDMDWNWVWRGMDKICVARRLVTQYCSAIAYSTGAGSFSRMMQWFPSTFCTNQKCNYFWFVQNIDRKRVTKIIKTLGIQDLNEYYFNLTGFQVWKKFVLDRFNNYL